MSISSTVPFRNLLAKDVLRDHFGELIQCVGSALIDHGMLTLHQLFTLLNYDYIVDEHDVDSVENREESMMPAVSSEEDKFRHCIAQYRAHASASSAPATSPSSMPRGADQPQNVKYSFQHIRNALIIMVQHNFVTFFTEEEFMERSRRKADENATDDTDGFRGGRGGGGWGNQAVRERAMQQQFEQEIQREAAEAAAARSAAAKRGSSKGTVMAGSRTGSKKGAARTKTASLSSAAAANKKSKATETSDASSSSNRVEIAYEMEPIIYYEIDLGSLLMRFKFSMFLSMIRERHGTHGELILDELLTHGRLSKTDIVHNVSFRLLEEEIHMRDENGELEMSEFEKTRFVGDTRSHLESIFDELVKGKFLIVVHPLLSEEVTLGAQRSLRDQIRTQQAAEKQQTSNKKKRKRTAEYFDEESGDEEAEEEEEEDTTEEQEKDGKGRAKKRRKIIVDDDDDDVMENVQESNTASGPANGENAQLFFVNFDQFIRVARHDAIVKYVGDKVNATAASIVLAMINLTSVSERSCNPSQSTRVQFASLLQEINKGENSMSGKNLQLYLDRLANDNNQIVTQSSTGSYVLNMGRIAKSIKLKNAESLIENKFGIIGSRIFRLLVTKKQLEQKQVAELAMIPLAEARTLLYRMFVDRITQLQEVSKALDHNPGRTYYLWNVNLSIVFDRLLDTLYKTVRNMRMRLAKEQRDALDTIGGGLLGNINNLSAEQQQYLKRLEKVEDRLETSIIHLNELLMCFESF